MEESRSFSSRTIANYLSTVVKSSRSTVLDLPKGRNKACEALVKSETVICAVFLFFQQFFQRYARSAFACNLRWCTVLMHVANTVLIQLNVLNSKRAQM